MRSPSKIVAIGGAGKALMSDEEIRYNKDIFSKLAK